MDVSYRPAPSHCCWDFQDASIVLGEQPVANANSAPYDRFWTWEFGVALQRRGSAASTPMQRLCAAGGKKLPHRTGRPVLPSLHVVLMGNADVQEAAAPTWSVGGCPEAQGHRRVHPRQRSVFRTSASHAFTRSGGARTFSQVGGGQSETIAHTGVARKLTFVKVAVCCGSGCRCYVLGY